MTSPKTLLRPFLRPFLRLTAIPLVVALGAYAFISLWSGAKGSGTRNTCASNLHQLGLALAAYARDNDNCFPDSRIPAPWTATIYPYTLNYTLFTCPVAVPHPMSRRQPFVSYWFNDHLERLDRSEIAVPSNTFLLGDGDGGNDSSDVAYTCTSIPDSWVLDTQSPVHSHDGGANYLMAQGGVRWLKPDQLADFKWR